MPIKKETITTINQTLAAGADAEVAVQTVFAGQEGPQAAPHSYGGGPLSGTLRSHDEHICLSCRWWGRP